MLNVVKFINENENWEELLKEEPYHIIIKKKDNLVMFNYTLGISKPCRIVNECRGLILDSSNNFAVVRYGFYRFYNYGEPGAAKIDIKSMYATEKIDGSLVMIYYYNGEWHISTRNTFDAEDAEVGETRITFDKIITDALKNRDVDINKLNKNYTYVFEVVSPESRVIIPYQSTDIYYLMARNNTSLEEVTEDAYYEYSENDVQTPLPKLERMKIYDISDAEEFVSKYAGLDFEGVVVQDQYNNRLKVKNPNWIKLHVLHCNGRLSEKRVIEMMFSGELAEYETYFPYEHDFISECVNRYNHFKNILELYDKTMYDKQFPNRKDFADFVKSQTESGIMNISISTYKTILFCAYDHKCSRWFEQLDANKYINLFCSLED